MRKIGGLILSVLAVTGLAKADNCFSEIDLTSFQDIPSIIDACDVPIENVSCSTKPNCRRFYITGLWGVSASNLTDVDDATAFENGSANIFTAGIAGGISFERENGRLRLETEWLQRDYFKHRQDALDSYLVATSNWSVLANVWRDFMFTDQFGCYGGGGLGGGGIQVGEIFQPNPVDYASPSTAFAWQAGGGLIYELSDQVTFDVSYRWYQLGNFQVNRIQNDNWQFSASQVMFSLRMFEPLRSLLR